VSFPVGLACVGDNKRTQRILFSRISPCNYRGSPQRRFHLWSHFAKLQHLQWSIVSPRFDSQAQFAHAIANCHPLKCFKTVHDSYFERSYKYKWGLQSNSPLNRVTYAPKTLWSHNWRKPVFVTTKRRKRDSQKQPFIQNCMSDFWMVVYFYFFRNFYSRYLEPASMLGLWLLDHKNEINPRTTDFWVV